MSPLALMMSMYGYADMSIQRWFFLLLFCAGCRAGVSEKSSDNMNIDSDQDGYTRETDCDDGDSSIFPGAEELCDGVDNNCDGSVDEDVLQTGKYEA